MAQLHNHKATALAPPSGEQVIEQHDERDDEQKVDQAPATCRVNPRSQSKTRMTMIVQSMVVRLRMGAPWDRRVNQGARMKIRSMWELHLEACDWPSRS